MIMQEGGLFSGDEKACAVSTIAAYGQSQSKEAKYHRAYRSNPENKDRINFQKKRRRQLKKEREMGNVSSMFEESVTLPTKAESQIVENVSSNSDTSSISDGAPLARGSEGLLRPSRCMDRLTSKQTSQKFEINAKDIESHRDFLTGVFDRLSKLDGEAFISNFPLAVLLAYFAIKASQFVYSQTLPLYKSLNFPDPELACYGALAIAIGFSALTVLTKSSFAKLMAMVIIFYEVILVFAGSKANQSQLAEQSLRANRSHFAASESYNIAKSDYEQKKARYEDKNSGVFQNGWFKINHLDPAKEKLDQANTKLTAIEQELENRYSSSHLELVLKVLYRLSAVALVMLLAKESIKRVLSALLGETHTLQA